MRDYQVTRLRGLRVIEPREGDKPGVWHRLTITHNFCELVGAAQEAGIG